MSTNLQDWVELLNAEQHVQVDKLREHARHGIAARVRGEVWLYLLDVLSEDKTSEITSLLSLNTSYQSLPSTLPSTLTSMLIKTALKHHTKRFRNETYADLITSITAEKDKKGSGNALGNESKLSGSGNPALKGADQQIPLSLSAKIDNKLQSQATSTEGGREELLTIRTQLSRILPPPPSAPPSRHSYLSILEEVLGKYYNYEIENGRRSSNDNDVSIGGYGGMKDDEKNWVYLATPFVCSLSRPVGIFLGFQKLMDRLNEFPSIPSRLASFLTLFRFALPELHSYCEDEQVPYVEVALSWMTTLLAKEMWLGDVLRLWDAYLSTDDMFALHCYVCVAILAMCKETLEELDGSEAKLMLLDLPPLDVDRLLQDAANLRVSFPLPRPVEEE